MRTNWIIQPPAFIRGLFIGATWREDATRKVVYLTFDDGPVPEQTPWVMDLLESYGIKGTFFCVGDNVQKHPELYADLRRRGHTVGNLTYNHMQLFREGWATYKSNILKCNEEMGGDVELFRPPHGQMSPWRSRELRREMGFRRVVFWDVMPADYDKSLSPEQVLQNVKDFVRPGSVIVFHDSIKAGERMRYALRGTIEHLKALGYEFATL